MPDDDNALKRQARWRRWLVEHGWLMADENCWLHPVFGQRDEPNAIGCQLVMNLILKSCRFERPLGGYR